MQPAPPMPMPAPAPAAAPSPQYNPPTPPPAPAPAPVMAEGGELGGSGSSGGGFGSKIKDFFSDINILDVAVSAFIVGGVLYAVHYYKFMMMMEKSGYADLSSRVQKLESQMAAAAKKSSEMNAAGNGKMPMRKKRALVTL